MILFDAKCVFNSKIILCVKRDEEDGKINKTT